MTKGEAAYLRDLKGLDDIRLGMVLPSAQVCDRWHHAQLRDRLLERGWIFTTGQFAFGEPIVFLATKGLRALRRAPEGGNGS